MHDRIPDSKYYTSSILIQNKMKKLRINRRGHNKNCDSSKLWPNHWPLLHSAFPLHFNSHFYSSTTLCAPTIHATLCAAPYTYYIRDSILDNKANTENEKKNHKTKRHTNQIGE